MTAPESGLPRSWHVRIHLRVGQRVASAMLHSSTTDSTVALDVEHLTMPSVPHFPFGGAGSGPAPQAGPIAEMVIESTADPRRLELVIV